MYLSAGKSYIVSSYLCADLVTALAGLEMDNFPHGCGVCVTYVCSRVDPSRFWPLGGEGRLLADSLHPPGVNTRTNTHILLIL